MRQDGERSEEWSYVIGDKKGRWKADCREFLQYRELVWIFVKRDFTARFKQTVLGPVWILIHPLFTMATYTIVFGWIASLSTDGIPAPVFYLTGNILWTFLASNFNCARDIFTVNAGLFSKIYFPRLVTVCANMVTNFLDFLLQLVLALVLMGIYAWRGVELGGNGAVLLLPPALLQLGLLGTGAGLLVSSLTTKYRDLQIAAGFLLTLWMYASPVIYSLSLVPEALKGLYLLNPAAPALLIIKYGLFGTGGIPWGAWGSAWVVTLALLFAGVHHFQRVQRTFQDTF